MNDASYDASYTHFIHYVLRTYARHTTQRFEEVYDILDIACITLRKRYVVVELVGRCYRKETRLLRVSYCYIMYVFLMMA